MALYVFIGSAYSRTRLLFLQTAEHVLGSVLCSPGCFSVYRCKAIKDVLPTYATNVEHAADFLKKDMGEDRWLSTLLVYNTQVLVAIVTKAI